jgi:hypothetical protein
MSTIHDQVKRAFAGVISANDSALSQDQIRAISIICANVDFARAVGKELLRLGIVKIEDLPSENKKKTESSSSDKGS